MQGAAVLCSRLVGRGSKRISRWGAANRDPRKVQAMLEIGCGFGKAWPWSADDQL